MIGASETIKRATIGIALVVLVSKAIGFAREMVIAYKFGTGIEYDVYLVAVSIPLILYELLYASFLNLMIPNYAHAVVDVGKAGRRQLWTQFNLYFAGALALMLLVILGAPRLITFIAPGLDSAHLSEAVFITRVSSVLIIIAVLGSFFNAILNAEKKFLLPAASPIIANLVIIVSIAIFAGRLSTRALMYGIVAGYFAQALVMFGPFIRTGMMEYIHARFIEPHIRKFAVIAIAILIIEAAAKVFSIIDRYYASYMDSGIISALGYSYLLATFPVAIFAYALSTAIFPYLSDAFATNNNKQSSYLLGRGISVSLLLSCPAIVVYWLFAKELVIILFQRGAFDYQSVAYTAGLLKYFAWAFPGQFILYVMSRAYFAARRFDILFVQIVLMVIAKILLTALGVGLYGAAGLPLATAASYSLGALVLLVLANRCLTQLDGKSLLAYFAKVLTATLIYGAVTFGLSEIFGYAQQDIFSIGLKLLICTIIPLMVFAAMAFILKIPEVTELVKLKRRGA